MKEISLPPFYVGQKVTPIKDSLKGGLISGKVYTVENITKCDCGTWMVGISEAPGFTDSSWHGTHVYYHPGVTCLHGDAKYFRPVQENFQSISLEKILEKETSLISAS